MQEPEGSSGGDDQILATQEPARVTQSMLSSFQHLQETSMRHFIPLTRFGSELARRDQVQERSRQSVVPERGSRRLHQYSLRDDDSEGVSYLTTNPQQTSEDIMWALGKGTRG